MLLDFMAATTVCEKYPEGSRASAALIGPREAATAVPHYEILFWVCYLLKVITLNYIRHEDLTIPQTVGDVHALCLCLFFPNS